MPTPLRESDLRPYQAHLLFSSTKPLDAKAVSVLFASLSELIDVGIDDANQRAKVDDRHPPRGFNTAMVGWMVYRRKVPVSWAVGPHAPRNEENHWIGIATRGAFLSLVATENALANRIHRAVAAHAAWKGVTRIHPDKLEAAFVQGSAKTLWLAGIHRSVPTKADSKVLMGRDLEASLDALGDQTYHYTATRCEGPPDVFTAKSLGVTPRQSKVWLGPASHWELFIRNSEKVLELLEGKLRPRIPYPLLARPSNSLKGISDAFDVGLERAELGLDVDHPQSERLQELVLNAKWSVAPTTGADCQVDISIEDKQHTVSVHLKPDADGLVLEAKILRTADPEEAKEVAQLFERRDIVKIYYESAHTFSDGFVFQVALRDIPFDVTGEDFTGFNVTKEKPVKKDSSGKEKLDLTRIGDAADDSLFTWIYRKYRSGWLWCDDGSGEMADFLHLTPPKKGAARVLSFIHAKAAHSDSGNRKISVSAYEVVCAQALKNLRSLDQANRNASLTQKIRTDKIGRCWKDGRPQGLRSPAFLRALSDVKYSELSHKVIVVQPHVRESLLRRASATAGSRRQAGLLYTLLNCVKADVDRMGATLEVVVDK